MIYEVINLRKEKINGFMPTLTAYVLDDPMCQNKKRPAVVVCPGGGYAFCSPREAEPIALKFAQAGYNTFVLDYSIAPTRFPAALEELSDAIKLIRSTEKWNVLSDKIAVCGFSAGAHLAGSIGMLWNSEPVKTADQSNRPNAMILSYPVIMYNEKGHIGSFDNLCGEDDALKEKLSLEKLVSKDTPPAFLWHTVGDNCVPVENSLVLATELQKNAIPYELHVYQKGDHGLSLATPEVGVEYTDEISTNVKDWIYLAINWLNDLFGVK